MYFRINGVAMFMKGANLIPFHTIRTMVTPERVNATMQGALDVHFNMLRVWGGGIYLPNDFYKMADRVGMLLWQEAMFA
jgi:beta-mannosidase